MLKSEDFHLTFTSREVSAWGGLALLKKMMDSMGLKESMRGWEPPAPGSNRGYDPIQLVEQLMVSIWTGANRFVHTDITRLDSTLARIFGWSRVAAHKSIVRLFQRFTQPSANHLQTQSYRWLFDKLALNTITLDMDSTVLTRWGTQIEGAAKGYNPRAHGRESHHPLLAFVSNWRLVANFWLRPGNAYTSNNVVAFIVATLENLGQTRVGTFRADSGFYDKAVVELLQDRAIPYVISAKVTQGLQQAMRESCRWLSIAPGLEVSEFKYQPQGWQHAQRMIVIRQNEKRTGATPPGKSLSLFADDPDLMGWKYSAMITSLPLEAVEIWRLYRGRADCENRIKELKYDFGMESFVLRDFWATEAALSIVMMSYNLMSVFRQAVIRQKSHQTLPTLHHTVLAIGAYWSSTQRDVDPKKKQTITLAVTRKRRPWFEGLWTNAHEPVERAYIL